MPNLRVGALSTTVHNAPLQTFHHFLMHMSQALELTPICAVNTFVGVSTLKHTLFEPVRFGAFGAAKPVFELKVRLGAILVQQKNIWTKV